MDPKTNRQSKQLSWLLRHGATEAGVAMDEAGWCAVADVLAQLGMKREELELCVRLNTKQRITLESQRVRACQGHSLSGTPVTQDALEESWRIDEGDKTVWHGTSVDACRSILVEGIHAGQRSHVHLAAEVESKVGKRAQVAVLIGVDPGRLRKAGIELFVAPNGVRLARSVPVESFTEIRGVTKGGKAAASELRGLLAEVRPL